MRLPLVEEALVGVKAASPTNTCAKSGVTACNGSFEEARVPREEKSRSMRAPRSRLTVVEMVTVIWMGCGEGQQGLGFRV